MALSASMAQGRRTFLTAALGALLLAGCAGRPLDRPGSGNSRVNRVAVLVPLTGPDAVVGRALGNAARLAMLDTGTKAFELTLFDTAQRGSAAAAQQAIGSNHGLILGPLLSADVRAATPLAQRARVPLIAFSNDREATAPGTYILGFTPSQAVERVVLEAAARGSRRFAAIARANEYGQRSVQALAAAVGQTGGQVVGVETYDSLGASRAAVRRLSSRPYDAILIADNVRTAGLAAPGVPAGARILGTELWATSSAGASTRLRGAWFAAPTEGRWSQFLGRYRARYPGQNPPRIASLGYDAVLLAARAARTWKPGRRFPLGAINDREGFAGVDGIFRFRSDNVAQRAFEVRALTASGSTLVSPAPTSF
ncbi:penicillin-binding protein activator [Sphingomonas glaciei]|uniref:Penicillin-binding protein activator n=1 Tax=Sphingomonas glaciei TaxID=2938948 RepID=A0ABY5MYQ2_9SPHN|nr:penicillin-binding protein activator [Sphingomonas glaciei]UUR09149.1 penicillin-binding protein activator [Sphingomonas glaciei]